VQNKLYIQESINHEKLNTDLVFIRSFLDLSKSIGFRLILSGGYGIDFYLHQITRDHNDVDLIIYGLAERAEAGNLIGNWLKSLLNNPTIKITPEMFYEDIDVNSQALKANLYYVHTTNDPYKDLQHIIRQDGKNIENSVDRFPTPVSGKLNDITVEVQDPCSHLADILYKRINQENRINHDQDIQNLRLVTDQHRVSSILALM